MEVQQYIEEINKASRERKLVFFVGARVSTLSGYPKWADLIDAFYKVLYNKEREGILSSDDYLRIPQIFYDVLEENEKYQYDEILKEIFEVKKEPNAIHYKILSLNPVHIITTNYDDLLEKACWQRGKYYTKISAEKDVSSAISSQCLLKVHGDFSHGFKAENIVLKESDYMSYDQNYPLISNLMKTIMSTYTIVFIGYGLGDYNINLLLHWVKHLQKDGFSRPFFIRTDQEPIKDSDAKYFENKGLRIIDASSLIESNEEEYLKRYNAVMDRLINYQNNDINLEDSEVIELIYKKVSPLFVLKNIRKTDLKEVFDNDYLFDIKGLITKYSSIGENYIERFYNIHIEENKGINELARKKYNEILNFFEKNNILGMSSKVEIETIDIIDTIENPIFHANYDEVEQLIKLEKEDDIEFCYKKAFYLAYFGKWEESYKLYSRIISCTIQQNNLWIYYLSQINRYHLYQLIIQRNRISILSRNNDLLFSDNFIKQIESELKNFDLNNLFSSMSNEFQDEYKILKFLSNNKFLYDDIVELFKLINKVREDISKGTIELGLKSEIEIMLKICETTKFLFDNHLWSAFFYEFKKYVKRAMMLLFEKAEYDLAQDRDPFFNLPISSQFYVDYFGFVIISKTFCRNDIEDVERVCDIKTIPFKEEDKIEEYLLRLVHKMEEYSDKDALYNNALFWNFFINELKSAIYFARYVSLSSECITKLIKIVLFKIPIKDMNNDKKYKYCERLIIKNGLPKEVIPLIEKFLLKETKNQEDINCLNKFSDSIPSHYFSSLIHHYYPDYISTKLSKYAFSINKESSKEINYLYKLSKILSLESRRYLFSNKNISSIDDVIDCLNEKDIKNIAEYKSIIVDHVSNSISRRKNNIKEGMGIDISGDHLIEIAAILFKEKIKIKELEKFKGVVDEYDMFISPEEFDYRKFDPIWLQRYYNDLLMKISENKYMRDNIVKILKEKLINSKDHVYLRILLNYFV